MYSVIATNVAQTTHTVTALTLGTIYEWTIEARNSDGYSDTSSSLTILHAIAPE